MKKHLLIILFLISLKSFACTCVPKKLSERQKSELKTAEYIFIGDVIEINKTDFTFKIKVTESLSRKSCIDDVYIGKNWRYCYPYIQEKGKWIVYGNIEKGFLRLNPCGISRLIDNPVADMYPTELKYLDIIIDNPDKKYIERIEKEIAKEKLETALKDLNLEIIALRERKLNLSSMSKKNNEEKN